MAGAPDAALPAAVSVGARADDLDMSCDDSAPRPRGRSPQTRWRFAASPPTLRVPLEEALAAAAREPARDATPVERWLRHFDLPLTAAWSSKPRGMLVLLSPARGWRQPEDTLARELAAAGVHVVGIDALRSFWQRRSPRDVALELQRLTDALASTGLPVFIGGREFGAETMAVAGEMMAPSRKIAGVVLVDPGPTAFFEVEPPALALRPLSPSDWSTRAAVARTRSPDALRDARAGLAVGAAVRVARLAAVRPRSAATPGDDTPALAARRARIAPGSSCASRRQTPSSAAPRKARAASPRASCGTASTGAGEAHSTR